MYLLDLGLETASLLTAKGPDLSTSARRVPMSSSSGSTGPKGASTTTVVAVTKKPALRGGILLSISQLQGQSSHALDTETITGTVQLLKNSEGKGLQLL